MRPLGPAGFIILLNPYLSS